MKEKPSALVIVPLTLSTVGQADIPTVGDVKTNANYAGIHLEFKPDDWETARSVYVTGSQDTNMDGTVITQCRMQTISTDARYNGYALEPVQITCLDDEIGTFYERLPVDAPVSGTFSSISSTGQVINPTGVAVDDKLFAYLFPDGFSFRFLDRDYNKIYICTNGMLTFDSDATEAGTNLNTNLFASNTGAKFVLAPWWDNLVVNDPISKIYAKLRTGGPERVLVFEWNNVYPASYTNPLFSFQVKLYETSHRIDFVYGPSSYDASLTEVSASIGLKGTDATGPNFLEGTSGTTTFVKDNLAYLNFPVTDTIIAFRYK